MPARRLPSGGVWRAGLLLVLLLAASLAGKALSERRAADPAPRDSLADLAAYLAARGYAVSVADTNTAPVWVSGTLGGCLVRIADVPPQGWARSIVAQLGAGQQVRYAFGGGFYPDQPVLLTSIAEYRQRLLRYFGLVAPPPIVRAILVSPACPAGTIGPAEAPLLS